jgi:hypothetical protein
VQTATDAAFLETEARRNMHSASSAATYEWKSRRRDCEQLLLDFKGGQTYNFVLGITTKFGYLQPTSKLSSKQAADAEESLVLLDGLVAVITKNASVSNPQSVVVLQIDILHLLPIGLPLQSSFLNACGA